MVHPVHEVHCERSVLYQWWVNEIWLWSIDGVIPWRENQSTWRRACPSSNSYTTNLLWIGLGLNWVICTVSVTTNCLSLFQRYCNFYWILNMCWYYKELTSVLVRFEMQSTEHDQLMISLHCPVELLCSTCAVFQKQKSSLCKGTLGGIFSMSNTTILTDMHAYVNTYIHMKIKLWKLG